MLLGLFTLLWIVYRCSFVPLAGREARAGDGIGRKLGGIALALKGSRQATLDSQEPEVVKNDLLKSIDNIETTLPELKREWLQAHTFDTLRALEVKVKKPLRRRTGSEIESFISRIVAVKLRR